MSSSSSTDLPKQDFLETATSTLATSKPSNTDSSSIRPSSSSSREVTSTSQLSKHPKSLAVTSSKLLSNSIDAPQLSERDSIFATTYLPSTSPPGISNHEQSSFEHSIRPHGVQASEGHFPLAGASRRALTQSIRLNTQPSSSRKTTTTANQLRDSRYSSTILSRHSNPSDRRSPKSSSDYRSLYSQSFVPMGYRRDDETEPAQGHLGSPILLATSPSQIDDDVIAQLDEEEEAERLRYRSWRQGNPDLRKAGATQVRSKSGGSRMNRKIQATIPKPEAQPISTRSRKSSHYLGLFKEKDAVDERGRQGRRLPTVSDIPSPRTLSGVDTLVESPVISAGGESEDDKHSVYEALAHGGPQFRHASTSTISSSRSHPDLKALIALGGKAEYSPRSPRPKQKDGTVDTPSFSNFQLPPPAEVLEIPLRKKVPAERTLRQNRHGGDGVESEGEHSDREHISSATYYPHRQVRPDMSPELEGTVRPTLSRTQSAKVTVDQLERASEDEQIALQPSTSPEEVEISLESEDERQLWKGDYPIETDSPEDDPGFTSHAYDEESSTSEFESHDESTASTAGYDSDEDPIPDISATTPKARRPTRKHTRHPLGAVELKPFNHQVGGHSTVYQFSRRAVCKQLNNRENVFYETVEKYHSELLEFMPRYIGVVNVTYSKTSKRKNTKSSFLEDGQSGHNNEQSLTHSTNPPHEPKQEDQPRIVSHSQQQLPRNSTPQVIFENNRHIIPESLFRVPSRPRTPDRTPEPPSHVRRSSLAHLRPLNPIESVSRDSSPKPQIKKWGSTYVNRKLQEQVLREVFAPPVIHRHRHIRGQNLSSTDLAQQANSVSNSTPLTFRRDDSSFEGEGSKSLDLGHMSEFGVPLHPSRTGPQEDTEYIEQYLRSNTDPPNKHVVRRRHSGGGLRRRVIDVSGPRGNLEFHEKDPSLEDDQGVFSLDMEGPDHSENVPQQNQKTEIQHTNGPINSPLARLQTEHQVGDFSSLIPSPRNPVQARVQADERNEMFILLEDLTSRMRRPCVLDLKMGTRQYGIEADEKKQRSQQRKCQTTTSRKLGVRVCGMQVWNVKSQSYLFEDKYFGRDLKAGAEFKDALTRFFFDGLGYTSALRYIPIILEKLARMERLVRDLPGYRFYASSLLILYDRGAEDDEAPSSSPSPDPEDLATSPKGTSISTSTTHPALTRAGSGPPKLLSKQDSRKSTNPSTRPSPIKLKIVDFANCVTAEDTDRISAARVPPHHPDDVDRGYLRGLRSLRIYFQRVWKELSDEEWVERGEADGMIVGEGGGGSGRAGGARGNVAWADVVPEDLGGVSS